jgi:5-methyltetrahydropteroyltriglutamate--homocysteine methyltransferase
MRRSEKKILTTHVGSLSRPPELLAANAARVQGRAADETAYGKTLGNAVAGVVQQQRTLGIDIVNDGEFGKPTSQTYDYSPWWTYVFERLDGFSRPEDVPEVARKASSVANVKLGGSGFHRDWELFDAFYKDQSSGLVGSAPTRRGRRPVCTGPVRYKGHAKIKADIENLKAAMAANGVEEGFMTSVSPASFARAEDLHYKSEEEQVFAAAEAIREEYKAIVDGGLVLQIDDPSLPTNWDMISPEPPVAEYKKFAMARVEALNHALRGLPHDRIRYHMCWGSWHGPHVTDLPLEHIVDVMLQVTAGAYSIEAGNVRHEHEWRVWQDTKLPDGKLVIPGVVSHATNVVEHPRVVADRIVKYAKLVSRENVLAGTDCGLGGRIHPQIVAAKLEALAEGAKLASRELWN